MLIATISLLYTPALSSAQGTAFTYQGRLADAGAPANGTYDFRFALYDLSSDGNQVSATLTNTATVVTGGVFTVTLDFGSAFDGSPRWLELGVRSNGVAADFTSLWPRQAVTPTPYAMLAQSAVSVPAGGIVGTIPESSFATNVAILDQPAVFSALVTGQFAGDGSGLTNVPGSTVWQTFAATSLQGAVRQGYLATNSSQVTITLPSNPNPGETIRVSGGGTGGWKLGQGSIASVHASGASFWRYTAWTNHGNSLYWNSLASSADGLKLVASASGAIYTSADAGNTWVNRTNSGSTDYVACSADGTRLIAVRSSGTMLTSPDSGLTWNLQIPPVTPAWRAVAMSADGMKVVALPSGGNIYTSTDGGVSWVSRSVSAGWVSVASSADGTKLLAASTSSLYTSTNSGANWTQRTNYFTSGPPGGPYVASSQDGTRLAALSYNGPLLLSLDSGATWTSSPLGNRNWVAIACSADGSRLVAAINNGTLYTSLDFGVTWVAQNLPFRNWYSLASSADGTRLIVGPSGGAPVYSTQLVSASGTTPGANGYLTGGQFSAVELQYLGFGQWMPISREGTIYAY